MAYPAYRAYWLGTLASVIGFQMLNFSQFWIMRELTESPLYLGYVGLANAVPAIVLNIFGGVLADKLDRKKLISITQTINGALILILSGLTFAGVIQAWHVIALAFLAGAINAFDQPARQALYPSLIDRSVMMNAVALNSAIWTGTRIIAPAIAGIIIYLTNTGTSFLISALGFFTMAAIVLSLSIPKDQSDISQSPKKNDLFEGIRFIWKNNIFLILICITFFNSFFGMSYIPMMPVFGVDILEVDADKLGILMGLSGVGALMATMIIGRTGNFKQKGLLIIVGSLLFGISITVFAFTSMQYGNYYVALVLLFIVGASSSTYMISIMSSLQMLVPNHMRGRVMGFYGITWSIMYLGGMYVGSLARYIGEDGSGVPIAVAIGGFLVAIFAIGPFFMNRNVRNLGTILQTHQIETRTA
ncbi:MAG: MFS transporter [Chloroflexota bacterium]|nr:MFS transporter [Chloroflexota bacterium]